MKVIVQNRPALRTLSDEGRKAAERLIDQFARSLTGKRLKAIASTYKPDDVYALTSEEEDLRIFLEIDPQQETVTVVDALRPSLYRAFPLPANIVRVENLLA